MYFTQFETGQLSAARHFDQLTLVFAWQLIPIAVDLGRSFAYRNQAHDIMLNIRDSAIGVIANLPALKHALAELIATALNYAVRSRPIQVSQWQADNALWVSILNFGGADQDEQQRAFEAFDPNNRDQGIGTYIAHRIITVHGGTLETISIPNGGIDVTLRFPLLSPASGEPIQA